MKAPGLLFSFLLLAVACSKNPASLTEKAASAISQLSNPIPAPPGQATFVAQFTPDGKRIVVAGKDGTTQIWDARPGQPLITTNGPTIQIWDVNTGKPVPPRYQPNRPDNMPMIGPDNFQKLQDQIDALEKRVQELEKTVKKSGR